MIYQITKHFTTTPIGFFNKKTVSSMKQDVESRKRHLAKKAITFFDETNCQRNIFFKSNKESKDGSKKICLTRLKVYLVETLKLKPFTLA
jgi:hypothetical protein